MEQVDVGPPEFIAINQPGLGIAMVCVPEVSGQGGIPADYQIGYARNCLAVSNSPSATSGVIYVNVGGKDAANFDPIDLSAVGNVLLGTLFGTNTVIASTNEMNIAFGATAATATSALAIDDSAITGNTAAASTAGKDVFIGTQNGGASAADASGADGARFLLTAGDGAAGGAHTSNNPSGGAGGIISLTAGTGGAAGAGGSGAAGADGVVSINSAVFFRQSVPAAKTVAVTLTAAELLTGIVTATHSAGATAAYTLPTDDDMDLALPTLMGSNRGFYWSLINLSAAAVDTVTVTANTNHSIVGYAVVASAHATTAADSSARFFTRKATGGVFVTYRVS